MYACRFWQLIGNSMCTQKSFKRTKMRILWYTYWILWCVWSRLYVHFKYEKCWGIVGFAWYLKQMERRPLSHIDAYTQKTLAPISKCFLERWNQHFKSHYWFVRISVSTHCRPFYLWYREHEGRTNCIACLRK